MLGRNFPDGEGGGLLVEAQLIPSETIRQFGLLIGELTLPQAVRNKHAWNETLADRPCDY